MTYFPLHQTTCFFIPLVAPCKPLLMITHNDDIARLADRIIRIEDGKITGGMEL